MPRIDDEYDSMMNMMPTESSSESNLRASATSRESYSEQRLRKNAKPMVKAKAKPKAKPVVGRAGAQTPGQRAKLAPAKSADAARAGAMNRPKSSSTGGYPRPTAKTTSTGAKSSVKRPFPVSYGGKAGSISNKSASVKKTATKPATRTSTVNSMAGAGRAGGVRGGAQNMPYKAGTKTTTTNMPYKAGTKYATVAATNAKRMGISVAEYNRRLNAKRGK